MKKLAIFVMAGLLLVFGASLVFANPQVDDSEVTGGANSNNTADASASTGSAATGVGDVANNNSTLKNKEIKIWGNSKTTTIDKSGQVNDSNNTKNISITKTFTKDSNNTKTVTIDKSGQVNDSNNTKNYKSNNTSTKTKYDVEAKK
ncbi:MAG: hypothetical protein ACOZFS_01260, partial [Thermodesulfobacteriota bacterium]